MRHVGQSWKLRVALEFQTLTNVVRDTIKGLFDGLHEQTYGYSVQGGARRDRQHRLDGDRPARQATRSSRHREPAVDPVCPTSARGSLQGARGPDRCRVYDRYLLDQGMPIEGPAIIEEIDSTIVVNPGYAATVAEHGTLSSGPHRRGANRAGDPDERDVDAAGRARSLDRTTTTRGSICAATPSRCQRRRCGTRCGRRRCGWAHVGEDPAVDELVSTAAELAGKEAGLFVTSGSVGNLLAVMSHAERGDQVILEEGSHIACCEEWGIAYVCGVYPSLIPGDRERSLADRIRPILGDTLAAASSEDESHLPREHAQPRRRRCHHRQARSTTSSHSPARWGARFTSTARASSTRWRPSILLSRDLLTVTASSSTSTRD